MRRLHFNYAGDRIQLGQLTTASLKEGWVPGIFRGFHFQQAASLRRVTPLCVQPTTQPDSLAMKYTVFDRKKWGEGEGNGGSKTPSKTIIGENPGGRNGYFLVMG